ncbi:MAG: polysaccharide biosynthesis/export family protein, partial [Leadbetterella sp.]|nr:polysaccharide biosynthesis/export family protein [Leadbetterella sp.]
MKKLIKIALLFLIVLPPLFLQSCRNMREIALFQSADSLAYKQIPRLQPEVARIQPNDILAITVSSMDQKSNEILNFANVNRLYTTTYPGLTMGGQNGQPLGYMVDALGQVQVPFIGQVNLNNKTLSEAADVIRQMVDSTLVANPAVNVRFLNHKFSVLGEVGRPGTFNLLDDRTTLPEALAMAGDVGIFGNRQWVMLVRENQGNQD